MSLGFLTEAAILPRKQKSISVDKKSLVNLKSILYEKEEAIRSNQGGRGSGGGEGGGGVGQPESSSSLVGGGELRALRGKRKASVVLGGADYKGNKGVFAHQNKGVTARRAKDEREKVSSKRKLDQSQQALRAKVALYNRIASGEIAEPGESGLLVNFGTKTDEDIALLERARERERSRQDDEESDIEVVDEFGRDKVVKRGSIEHQEYLSLKRKQAAAAVGGREVDSGEQEQSSTVVCGEHENWSWGRGSRSSDTTDVTLAGKREMKELLNTMSEDTCVEEGPTTHFRLRNRWEEKLGKEQKEYIKEMHVEAAEKRKSSEQRKTARANRLEKLRAKHALHHSEGICLFLGTTAAAAHGSNAYLSEMASIPPPLSSKLSTSTVTPNMVDMDE